MPPKGKYTDPKLRDQVKEDVQNDDKGGAPGQWSARKAQFMASEYKKRGGGYTTDKETGQDESQKNLSKWSEEEWQTKEGSGTAKHDDGTRDRYLPKKAWEQMSEKEKEETNDKKQEASAQGQQHVENTDTAKKARGKANKEEGEKFDDKKSKQTKGKTSGKKDDSKTNAEPPRRSGRGAKKDADEKTKAAAEDQKDDGAEETAAAEKDDAEFQDPGADDEGQPEHPDTKNDDKAADANDNTIDQPNVESAKTGQKRGRQSKKDDEFSKKQKGNDGAGKKNGTVGSKHDNPDEPAPAGSADRLPKVGQRASWKSLPGWVHGEVVEVLTKDKKIDGKMNKASEKAPKIILKSDNGKNAAHKVESVHFE